MTRTGRLRLLAGVWAGAGVLLVLRGMPYLGLVAGDVPSIPSSQRMAAAFAAVVVALVHGFAPLRKAGLRARARILADPAEAPARTVFPPSSLALVLGMVALGAVLRLAPYPDPLKAWVVGVLYPGIGASLWIGAVFVVGSGVTSLRPP